MIESEKIGAVDVHRYAWQDLSSFEQLKTRLIRNQKIEELPMSILTTIINQSQDLDAKNGDHKSVMVAFLKKIAGKDTKDTLDSGDIKLLRYDPASERAFKKIERLVLASYNLDVESKAISAGAHKEQIKLLQGYITGKLSDTSSNTQGHNVRDLETTVGLGNQANLFADYFNNRNLNRLKDVNIKSFLEMIEDEEVLKKSNNLSRSELEKYGYESDGSFGQIELAAVKFVLREIRTDPKLKEELREISKFYRRGLTIREYVKSSKISSVNDKNIGLIASKIRLDRVQGTKLLGFYERLPEKSKKTALKRLNEMGGNPFSLSTLQDNLNLAFTYPGVTYADVILGGLQEKVKTKSGVLEIQIALRLQKKVEELKSELKAKKTQTYNQVIKKLDELKDPKSELTKRIIKAAQTMGVNLGKGSFGAGGALTYEAFLRGLNFSVGLGTDGTKIAPGLAISYTRGKELLRTQSRTFDGSLTGGIAGSTAFVPFISGSLATGRSIEILDSLGRSREIGVSLTGYPTGGAIMLNINENREKGIENKKRRLIETINEISLIEYNGGTEREIKDILNKNFNSSSDIKDSVKTKAVNYWLEAIKSAYKLFKIDNNSSFMEKQQVLTSLVNREIEKQRQNRADTTKDASDFTGFGVGIAHLLGVTFPIASFGFEKVKRTNLDPNRETTAKQREISIGSETQESISFKRDDFNSKGLGQYSQFFLDSRSRYASGFKFNDFQKEVVEGNYEEAGKILEGYLNGVIKSNKNEARVEQAGKILKILGENPEPQVLSYINSLTSGSRIIRGLGEINVSQRDDYISRNEKRIERELEGLKRSALTRFKGMGLNNEIKKAYDIKEYKKLVKGNTKKIKKNEFGVVNYSQTLGGARGLDQANLGMPYIKAGEEKNMNKEVAKLLLDENKEYKEKLKNRLGINDNQLYDLFSGETVTVSNGKEYKLKGKIKYYLFLAAVDGAICTNAGINAEVPDIKVTGKTGKTETIQDILPNQPIFDVERTNVGISFYSENQDKEDKPPENKPQEPQKSRKRPKNKPKEPPEGESPEGGPGSGSGGGQGGGPGSESLDSGSGAGQGGEDPTSPAQEPDPGSGES